VTRREVTRNAGALTAPQARRNLRYDDPEQDHQHHGGPDGPGSHAGRPKSYSLGLPGVSGRMNNEATLTAASDDHRSYCLLG